MTQTTRRIAGQRLNVLVYDGPGVSAPLQHALVQELRAQLSSSYDVIPIDAHDICTAPWEDSTAMFVMPGGRDIVFLQSLSERRQHSHISFSGIDRISRYVRNGGRFLGICAGAYFACSSIRFEEGFEDMQVTGPRPLRFFPAPAVGSVVPGFTYNSELGAAAVHLSGFEMDEASVYVNGGPFFDLSAIEDIADAGNVLVLARYSNRNENVITPTSINKPAIVECTVGSGVVILSGPHLEVSAEFIRGRLAGIQSDAERSHLKSVLDRIVPVDHVRTQLLRHVLGRCGLYLNDEIETDGSKVQLLDHIDPPLTPIVTCFASEHDRSGFLTAFASTDKPTTSHTVSQLHESNQGIAVSDSLDQWLVVPSYADASAIRPPEPQATETSIESPNQQLILVPTVPDELPQDTHDTLFSVKKYLDELNARRKPRSSTYLAQDTSFGLPIMYARVVTSTQSILEKNAKLRASLPDGVVFVGSHQTRGRGRGRNSWISQKGCLQFSFKMRHKDPASMVFVQYLFGLAVVEAIQSLPNCKDLPMRLKWPNDIYAVTEEGPRKIGGILITSEYQNGAFSLIVGCGLNVDNPKPTLCINDLLQRAGLDARVSHESVLAAILHTFGLMYEMFASEGSSMASISHDNTHFAFEPFLEMYHRKWLHSNQTVRILEDGVPREATILGLDRSGYLLAQLRTPNREIRLLQPDGNSFDMIKGLICSK